jgi:KAP family P-loop domain
MGCQGHQKHLHLRLSASLAIGGRYRQYSASVPTNMFPESPSRNPRPGQQLRLASLAPAFDEERHRLYYDLLVRAIDADDTYNVALTGAYGTGKSSILDQLRKDRPDEVMTLSLSTIAPEPDEPENAGHDASARASSRTNLIQKEIVKQLLYRLPPRRVPRSRFRRTSAPDRTREWILAIVTGLAFFVVALSLGLVQRLVEELFVEMWRQAIASAALAGIAVGIAWCAAALVRGRPTMAASVNAGAATISLSKSSDTFFDQYLDEIVYFFQVKKAKVVIIEDIDRFEDVQVFDTLRALNGLLNSSKQIDSRIVFVYAIRDSVFAQIGVTRGGPQKDIAKAALERASRTKFFDVIIPVVPFVSANNARDVMSRAMQSDDFAIAPALIRLAARYVADMRLMHNIRNEFEVYRSRLVVPEASGSHKRVPGITDDLVFAIVLFKNTHLADFERFRHQDSTLDQLYSRWRELVKENLDDRTSQLRELRKDLLSERTASSRATDLGRRVVEFAEILNQAAQRAHSQGAARLASIMTPEKASERETWSKIASGESLQVNINMFVPTYGRMGEGTLSFTANQLAKLLAASIDPKEWRAIDIEDAKSRMSRIEREIDFLRHHTWEELCNHREFMLPPQSFPGTEAQANANAAGFDDLVERVLESDLARDLVRNGFLTSHFALYASSYYGEHLGPDAMEYITRCVEPGTPDASYALSNDDVVQILREQGAGESDHADLLSDPSVFNISILDYLLEQRPAAATTMARRLSNLGDQERAFVDLYVAQGKHPEGLVTAMVPTWSGILRYAAGDAPVDATSRLRIMDACLRALPNSSYEVDGQVRQLFETGYRDIDAITCPESAERANIVLHIVEASGALLESIESLNDEALDAVLDLGLYPITEANLRALAPTESIALDALQSDDRVYRRALEQLADYLDAFQASPSTLHTVEDPALFATIINDAARDAHVALLGTLIASASRRCRIPTLTEVPSVAWPFLMDGGRTDPTLDNVSRYMSEFEVDEHLGSFLTEHPKIVDWGGTPADERLRVAVRILTAGNVLPDAELRVRLAAGLEPGQIPATSIQPESGPLIGLLLHAGLLVDDETAFTKVLMVDWVTYEAAITASTNFTNIVSPALLSVSQIPNLLYSNVGNTVKATVVDQIADYLVGATGVQAQGLARALNDRGWTVGYEALGALTAAGAENEELIKLMARKGDSLAITSLKVLLKEMAGDYLRVVIGGRGRPTFPDNESHRDVLNRLIGDTIGRLEPASFKGIGPRLVAHLTSPRT